MFYEPDYKALYDSIIQCIIHDNVNYLSTISAHADIKLIDSMYGNEFLMIAMQYNSINVIYYMLETEHFDITAKDKDGICSFDMALSCKNNVIRKMFIDYRNSTKPLSLHDSASFKKRKQYNNGMHENLIGENVSDQNVETDLISLDFTPQSKAKIQQNYTNKLNNLQVDQKTKTVIKHKINNISSFSKDTTEWLDSFFKIPFNNYSKLPVNRHENSLEDIQSYFINVKVELDKAAYGMENVKEEIIDIIAQLVSSPHSTPKIIGLCGSPGIGKTNFIKNGLATILKRPFQHICMGGMYDSSYLFGHSSTYTNSKPGIIVNSLINANVMNPIIFMDELDKVSCSDRGNDIQNVLIHMTDPVQNTCFMDRYFQGIDIDLSRVLFIFSFNDENKIDPILRDRIKIIYVNNPSTDDKINICKYHLIPSILKNINLPVVNVSDRCVKYIIENYCKEDIGVRSLKQQLETLLLKINTSIYNPCTRYKSLKQLDITNLKITQSMIDEILVRHDQYKTTYGHMYL